MNNMCESTCSNAFVCLIPCHCWLSFPNPEALLSSTLFAFWCSSWSTAAPGNSKKSRWPWRPLGTWLGSGCCICTGWSMHWWALCPKKQKMRFLTRFRIFLTVLIFEDLLAGRLWQSVCGIIPAMAVHFYSAFWCFKCSNCSVQSFKEGGEPSVASLLLYLWSHFRSISCDWRSPGRSCCALEDALLQTIPANLATSAGDLLLTVYLL